MHFTAILMHDRVYCAVGVAGWDPLKKLLVRPGARPGILIKPIDIFVPFEQKKPYRLNRGRRDHSDGFTSWRAVETEKPLGWKEITKVAGKAKKFFVDNYL